MSRIDGLPIYEQRDELLTAKLYNLWRRAKLHFPLPIRMPLSGYRGLVITLEAHRWICADERQDDLPVLAWVEFEDQGRAALHLPVKCKLNHYHFAATKIRAPALVLIERVLEERLRGESF